jgi:hypothetical protein
VVWSAAWKQGWRGERGAGAEGKLLRWVHAGSASGM